MEIADAAVSRGRKTHRVVEIVGPAGAGKTTLCNELARYRDFIELKNFPNIRRLSSSPFFTWHGLKLASTLLQMDRGNSRQLTRREFAWMTVLNGWYIPLRQETKKNKKVVVMDQGPVYLMAEISRTGPEYLNSQGSQRLWQDIYCQWAATLDVIVWLDTTDSYLLKRIRTREKWHTVKDEATQTTIGFLRDFRATYENIFSELSKYTDSPKIIRVDTGQNKPDEIAKSLLADLKDGYVETVR
jgi:thymidylate kinase